MVEVEQYCTVLLGREKKTKCSLDLGSVDLLSILRIIEHCYKKICSTCQAMHVSLVLRLKASKSLKKANGFIC